MRNGVRITLRDYGKQANKRALRGRSHDLIKPGGLGLHLIRNAFDKVDYNLKQRGTELVLVKKARRKAESLRDGRA
jgi:serine/threonine-protein kinase RsbW